MTPAQLKQAVANRGTESYFFSRENMRFAGDTMSNYGVRSVTIQTNAGPADCWELYRKRPVKHGMRQSAFFRKDTLCQTWPAGY
jgi:hypothetical protein